MKIIALAASIATFAIALGGCSTIPPTQTSWLAGTRWAITDVNGVDTSARSDFAVNFSETRFEARFGCRRASGRYSLRSASNGAPEPIFQGSDAIISGQACTGSFAETVGPEILSNAGLSLHRLADGRVVMLEPPTGIALRPL
ncbi:META domain-containing protein [Novosphingobium kunmingense]|uniref:META domain-containing protein n=1 Tax=Novosphingobium kunmingense TaxID=1211806 RepID=UPI0012FE12E4|nr:META domain-containing protein [Novosphingobium kunmingense]